MLKLGTCLYNFIWESSLPDAVRRAARLGFRGIEIMATPPQFDARRLGARQRDDLMEAVRETGTEIVSVNPTFIDINLASRSEAFRRESVQEIKACIDAASVIGAQIVVVGPGRRHPLILEPVELSNSLAYPAIRECIEYAEARQITVGLENITSLYMTRSEEIARFVDETGSPYCKVVFDTANARYGEDPAQAVRVLGDRICHVHLSDSDGTVPAHWPVGQGDIDFGSVADALRDTGYVGWSFLETTWMDDPDWAISASAAALRAHGWEPVAPRSGLTNVGDKP
jgi:L-ribulose-5-phosphate 3-epimerase